MCCLSKVYAFTLVLFFRLVRKGRHTQMARIGRGANVSCITNVGLDLVRDGVYGGRGARMSFW